MDLRNKINAIRNICLKMNTTGYDVFQKDEDWRYDSDEVNPCPVCQGFHLQAHFSGDEIPAEFPINGWRQKPRHLHPQTHYDHVLPNGEPIIQSPRDPDGCNCTMIWTNFPEPIVNQLIEDMQRVI